MLVLREIWRHQKDILKLTGLYVQDLCKSNCVKFMICHMMFQIHSFTFHLSVVTFLHCYQESCQNTMAYMFVYAVFNPGPPRFYHLIHSHCDKKYPCLGGIGLTNCTWVLQRASKYFCRPMPTPLHGVLSCTIVHAYQVLGSSLLLCILLRITSLKLIVFTTEQVTDISGAKFLKWICIFGPFRQLGQ